MILDPGREPLRRHTRDLEQPATSSRHAEFLLAGIEAQR
jgi:hypothetical protein